MTSGYNYDNLIKSIVWRELYKRCRNYRQGYRRPGYRRQTFLSRQRKIEVIKVRRRVPRENKRGTSLNSACFTPDPRELETTFHARTLLDYLVIKFFKKVRRGGGEFRALTTHFFRCKSLGKCAVRVIRQFAHCNDV